MRGICVGGCPVRFFGIIPAMRILTRYVLREFLIPFGYCLTGFVSIYVLFDLFGSFSRMMNAHISFQEAALYFCAYLAPYFHYIVPAALMLAPSTSSMAGLRSSMQDRTNSCTRWGWLP